MRFFSNEANETDETDKTGETGEAGEAREHDSGTGTAARPVPQQRAGSPWQHDPAGPAGPDRQPVAVGSSAVGDDPDRTDRIPTTGGPGADADRTVALPDGRERDGLDGDAGAAPAVKADAAEAKADAAVAKADAAVAKADAAEVEAGAHEDHDRTGDARKDDAPAVDTALEDRGTFDDPHLTREIRSGVDDEPRHTADDPAGIVPAPAAATASSGPVAFFPGGDVESLRERWRDIQLRFVDDPKAATGEAAGLVDEAVDKLTAALRDHRGSLSTGTDDTESLRVELRGYRDILDRLLGI
ncbi:hypothetical protein [Actinoplanes sp. NPDC049802]|uniref:hypothetical protein n=1 Tax=Actinoplanes sp. NPDC049802 TaxID=3154742 RepID=UPI0033DA1F07